MESKFYQKILAVLLLCFSTQIVKAQFSGIYDPANWTVSQNPANTGGSVNTAGAPASISITSGNSAVSGRTLFTITILASGNVTFDWSYTTIDGANWDYPQYSINGGTPINLPGYSQAGSSAQNGTANIPVTGGQTFSLIMYTADGSFGAATTVFSNFTGPIPTPCAGVPAGGTANASVASACPSVSFTINVAGAAVGTGLSHQWQSSPNGLVWTDIAGATGPSYTGTQAAATSYRRRIICNAGPDTSYSTAASVALTPFLNCYCTSTSSNGCGIDYISNVTLGSINNSTGCGGGYNDYTSMSTNLITGLTYPMSVTTDGDEEGIGVWFDWNQNGSFENSEQVYNGFLNTTPATYNFSVVVPNGIPGGTTRMRVRNNFATTVTEGQSCTTLAWGETEDYFVNVLPPPPDEAGVLAITKPEIAACNLGNQIWVEMQNMGTNPLISATFTVVINGLPIPTTPWSGNVPPQSSMEVQVPVSYALADGDSVSVAVSMPNGQVENPLFAFNDITSRKVWAGLSGNKTVYGGGADFADVDAAIDALEIRGVCDTVYFKIATGSYTTQHTFPIYPGAGPGHLAVFESATGNSNNVDFSFDANGAGDNFVFRFDGADGYMVRNMTLTALDPTYAKIITFANAPQNITIQRNKIMGDTLAAYNAGDFERINIAGFDNTNPKNINISDNTIIGGSRSIDVEGSLTSYASNFTIENNIMEKYNVVSTLVANVSNPVFNNNTLRPRAGVVGAVYGYYVQRSIDAGMVSGNDIQSSNNGFMMYVNNVKGGSNNFWITNNFMHNADTGAAASYGIHILDANSSDIVIANNSISFSNNNTSSGAINVVDGSQIRMFNNNIGSFGDAMGVRIEKPYSVSESNNNNFFGDNLMNNVGSIYTTLAGLQAGTGRDANSMSVATGFNGTDLHTCTPELNGAGWPMAAITTDFDADVRGTMPDIGADEFVGDANGLLVEDAFLKCPADQVTIGNTSLNGVTYSWSPSGNTSEITTTNAGTYIITATSACGSFSDTATVVNKPLPTASFMSATVGLASIFDNNSTNGTSYMWDFGDGNTSTDENPSHVYSSAGTYSVTLTVTNDCGTATFGPTPVNVINAGIEENSNIEVSLFPNPTNGQFTVTMSEVNSDVTTISVIDVTGKTVMVKNIAAGVNQVTLDATTFASGIYSVKITNGAFTKVIRLIRK